MEELIPPTPPGNYPLMPATDHDAIVTLVSEMRQLRVEVKDIKTDIKAVQENVANRVSDLEQEKIDKVEAMRLFDANEKVHIDHEERLRELKTFKDDLKGKYAILAIVASVIISIIVSFLHSLFIHFIQCHQKIKILIFNSFDPPYLIHFKSN